MQQKSGRTQAEGNYSEVRRALMKKLAAGSFALPAVMASVTAKAAVASRPGPPTISPPTISVDD